MVRANTGKLVAKTGKTMARTMWLLKAEPDSRLVNGIDVKYSIDDLENDVTSTWEGVRNYQARNILKEMQVGDLAFFYRSNCKQPGIVGVMTISKSAFPDVTAQDPKHPYFDAKNKGKEPRWVAVEVKYLRHFGPVLLSDLKENSELKEMALLRSSRLSVSKVTEPQFETILKMGGASMEDIEKDLETAK